MPMPIVTIRLGLITAPVTLDTMELVYFAIVSICSKREFHYRQYYYQLSIFGMSIYLNPCQHLKRKAQSCELLPSKIKPLGAVLWTFSGPVAFTFTMDTSHTELSKYQILRLEGIKVKARAIILLP